MAWAMALRTRRSCIGDLPARPAASKLRYPTRIVSPATADRLGIFFRFSARSLGTRQIQSSPPAISSAACVLFSPDVIKATGKKDPREVVADELAGQAVTFLVAPFFVVGAFTSRQILVTVILGFLLFRLFDILKPFPIYRIQKLPEGWGILADDLLAGVYAAIVLQVCLSLGIIEYFS